MRVRETSADAIKDVISYRSTVAVAILFLRATTVVGRAFAADAYDGIYILVAAAEKAGITSDMTAEEACDLMIEAMLGIEVEGLTGTMTWDESGAVTKTPMAATIVNGVYVFED